MQLYGGHCVVMELAASKGRRGLDAALGGLCHGGRLGSPTTVWRAWVAEGTVGSCCFCCCCWDGHGKLEGAMRGIGWGGAGRGVWLYEVGSRQGVLRHKARRARVLHERLSCAMCIGGGQCVALPWDARGRPHVARRGVDGRCLMHLLLHRGGGNQG